MGSVPVGRPSPEPVQMLSRQLWQYFRGVPLPIQ
jgi:hypothetical protein